MWGPRRGEKRPDPGHVLQAGLAWLADELGVGRERNRIKEGRFWGLGSEELEG